MGSGEELDFIGGGSQSEGNAAASDDRMRAVWDAAHLAVEMYFTPPPLQRTMDTDDCVKASIAKTHSALITSAGRHNWSSRAQSSTLESLTPLAFPSPAELAFVQVCVEGVVRYEAVCRDAWTAFCNVLSRDRCNEVTIWILTYIAVFRLNELGQPAFEDLIGRSLTLNTVLRDFLAFLCDPQGVEGYLRPQWLQHYDRPYVDSVLVRSLQDSKELIQSVLKTFCGFFVFEVRAPGLADRGGSAENLSASCGGRGSAPTRESSSHASQSFKNRNSPRKTVLFDESLAVQEKRHAPLPHRSTEDDSYLASAGNTFQRKRYGLSLPDPFETVSLPLDYRCRRRKSPTTQKNLSERETHSKEHPIHLSASSPSPAVKTTKAATLREATTLFHYPDDHFRCEGGCLHESLPAEGAEARAAASDGLLAQTYPLASHEMKMREYGAASHIQKRNARAEQAAAEHKAEVESMRTLALERKAGLCDKREKVRRANVMQRDTLQDAMMRMYGERLAESDAVRETSRELSKRVRRARESEKWRQQCVVEDVKELRYRVGVAREELVQSNRDDLHARPPEGLSGAEWKELVETTKLDRVRDTESKRERINAARAESQRMYGELSDVCETLHKAKVENQEIARQEQRKAAAEFAATHRLQSEHHAVSLLHAVTEHHRSVAAHKAVMREEALQRAAATALLANNATTLERRRWKQYEEGYTNRLAQEQRGHVAAPAGPPWTLYEKKRLH